MLEILTIVPGAIDLETLAAIHAGKAGFRLDRQCRDSVDRAARLVHDAALGKDAVYGVNTGFGKLAQTRIPPEQTSRLQRNLILSHCCGVGDPLPDTIVRLVMAMKVASLGRGASGVRWETILQLEEMSVRGVIPVIPAQGSVGASGDLAPLAHMTAVMIGEGEAFFQGERMSGGEALSKAGLSPIVLGPKEGLGLINGTQVSTAIALAALFEAWVCAMTCVVSGALTTEAAMASPAPFRAEIQTLRGHRGQIDVGVALRSLTANSPLRESHRLGDDRVQDPYCIRCQPQVMGACIDILRNAAATLRIEANAVTDNPLVFCDDGAIISGGNFHAEPVALTADQIALALAEIGSICQRRIAMIVDPALNFGLPPFLSPNPGVNSGMMIAEVTTAALMSENKQRAAPCSVDSTPTSANQEDHVSMATHAARRLLDMTKNLRVIIGVELMVGTQGIELRHPLETSEPLRRVIARVRDDIAALGDDRYMAGDMDAAARLVRERAVLDCVPEHMLPSLEIA